MKLYTTPQVTPPPNAETYAERFRENHKTAYCYYPENVAQMVDPRNVNSIIEAVENDPMFTGDWILMQSTIEGIGAGFEYGKEYALHKYLEIAKEKENRRLVRRIQRKILSSTARILKKITLSIDNRADD